MAVAALPPPVTAPPLTYEAYLAEDHVEGSYEILDGERFFMPGANWRHQGIVGNVFVLLRAFEQATRSGKSLMAPFNIVIQRFPLRTRQPDAFFITNGRLAAAGGIPEEEPLSVGAELVVEVLSPSETPRSLRAKLEDFQRIGVREVWLVSPESETVQVLRLDGDGIEFVAVYAYGQSVTAFSVPGLTVTLEDIFAD